MKYPFLYILLTAVCSLLIFCSCRKFVQIEPAPNLVATDQVFTNEKVALSAVSSVYNQMRFSNRSMTNGGLSLFGSLLADDIYNTVSSTTADPFFNNNVEPNNNVVTTDFWNSSYSNLYRINAILESLDRSNGIAEPVKKQFKGEMKVCRAFYYFYLVNLFGDVPLLTGTDYMFNSRAARSASDSVYALIIRDLTDAQSLLSPAYPSAQRARPNLHTASALLARVYLYRQQWGPAINEASQVIQSSIYTLPTNLATNFQTASNEVIWQVAGDNFNTAEGASFLPANSTVKPAYALTSFLLGAFEPGDLRFSQWVSKNTVSGTDYYPAKYKSRTSTPVNEFNIVLRLAEQYLIRAEARLQTGDAAGALADINAVRRRAGLVALSTLNPVQLEMAIRKEKQAEFFAEWGHRWLDLKRTGRADAVLSLVKGSNWQSTDALLPIPFSQLQLNPFLSQNPGY